MLLLILKVLLMNMFYLILKVLLMNMFFLILKVILNEYVLSLFCIVLVVILQCAFSAFRIGEASLYFLTMAISIGLHSRRAPEISESAR